jgi:class 3 adenylate cyclase
MYAFTSGTEALSAGVKIQRTVSASNENILGLRVGVHTGDVIQNDNDYIGLTVNKAARVAAAADGGQILVSSITAGIVNTTDFVFGHPFSAELRGIDGVHLIQQLQWTQTSESTISTRP